MFGLFHPASCSLSGPVRFISSVHCSKCEVRFRDGRRIVWICDCGNPPSAVIRPIFPHISTIDPKLSYAGTFDHFLPSLSRTHSVSITWSIFSRFPRLHKKKTYTHARTHTHFLSFLPVCCLQSGSTQVGHFATIPKLPKFWRMTCAKVRRSLSLI